MIEDKIFKTLVGKTIYGIPQQNAVRRGTPLIEQIQKFTVVKVARLNVTLVKVARGYKSSYKKRGLDEANCGYDFYETQEKAEGYFTIEDLKSRLSRTYNLELTLSQAERITAILDEENSDATN